jgi:hypothetical protein
MPFSPPPPPWNVGDRTTQSGRVYVWDGYAWGLATDGQIATVPDGSRGDIVVSDSGSTWTIAAGAVSLAKTTGVQKSITSGTALPTGGSSGDIYLRHS